MYQVKLSAKSIYDFNQSLQFLILKITVSNEHIVERLPIKQRFLPLFLKNTGNQTI